MSTQRSNWGNSTTASVFLTLSGLPLSFELQWPFHRSGSGADFYLLHGDVHLEGSDGLHCLVAVQLTLTIKDVLPSLEPADVAPPVINTIRKQVERKQLEFLKSPKRVPIPFSARQYSFKRQQWDFVNAGDEQLAELLRRKVYWSTKRGVDHVWMCDLTDAQYLGSPASRLLKVASHLPQWLRLEGEHASATPELMAEGPTIEAVMHAALEELEKKHAFERG
jgi:hypothetical protein